jgi:hypothetical protein
VELVSFRSGFRRGEGEIVAVVVSVFGGVDVEEDAVECCGIGE